MTMPFLQLLRVVVTTVKVTQTRLDGFDLFNRTQRTQSSPIVRFVSKERVSELCRFRWTPTLLLRRKLGVESVIRKRIPRNRKAQNIVVTHRRYSERLHL